MRNSREARGLDSKHKLVQKLPIPFFHFYAYPWLRGLFALTRLKMKGQNRRECFAPCLEAPKTPLQQRKLRIWRRKVIIFEEFGLKFSIVWKCQKFIFFSILKLRKGPKLKNQLFSFILVSKKLKKSIFSNFLKISLK